MRRSRGAFNGRPPRGVRKDPCLHEILRTVGREERKRKYGASSDDVLSELLPGSISVLPAHRGFRFSSFACRASPKGTAETGESAEKDTKLYVILAPWPRERLIIACSARQKLPKFTSYPEALKGHIRFL